MTTGTIHFGVLAFKRELCFAVVKFGYFPVVSTMATRTISDTIYFELLVVIILMAFVAIGW